MLRKVLMISIAASALLLSNAQAIKQMWASDQTAQEAREQERIYGSQLMTEQERTEYLKKISTATDAEERGKIRQEHHALMDERARTQGVVLPDEPPADAEHKGHGH